MSAAATAAGYLYASGRLRARGKDEGAEGGREDHRRDDYRRPERREEKHETRGAPRRRPLRIAAIREPDPAETPRAAAPRPAVKVEYRTRRWRPALDE